MDREKIILIFGPPGAGKGTISSFLEEKYNYHHFSCGDGLRNLKPNYSNYDLIKDKLSHGKLLDDIIINQFFDNSIRDILLKYKKIVIEGYPRTLGQAIYFQNWLKENNLDLVYIFNLVVSEKTIYQRIVNRIVCPQCGAVYNLKFAKPKINNVCDKCHYSPLLKRNDDNFKTIKTRIDEYQKKTAVIINFLRGNNFYLTEVNEDHFLDLNDYFSTKTNL